METVHLVIDGEPVAKGRPRFYNGHTITPAKTSNYENYAKELFMISKQPKLEGYIEATIRAYFSIPKSTSNKKRQLMLEGEIFPTKRPDLDNIAKIVLDALNKLAYDDDSQVVRLVIEKYYDDNPRVNLTLKEI
jgi:Holliday junction resolvase RusA-like endonuclease